MKLNVFGAFLAGFAVLIASQVFSAELDILLDEMVDKGVFSPIEADVIRERTRELVARELVRADSYAAPRWTQKISLKGDFRFRYQSEEKGDEDRERWRYRFRLGGMANVSRYFKAAFGLASGKDDPRSTNQTLDNWFDTPDLRLDYAYAHFFPNRHLNLYAGKIKRKAILWTPSDLLWDSDVNPEGLAAALFVPLTPRARFTGNAGWMLLDEIKNGNDPAMTYVQPGFELDLTPSWSFQCALAVYAIDTKAETPGKESAGTSTLDSQTNYLYDYDSVSPAVAIEWQPVIDEDNPPLLRYVAGYAEAVSANDPQDDNEGWTAGVKAGHSSLKERRHWQVKYSYRELQKDAWLDALPDSDAYGGGTDVKGHEYAISYAPWDNVVLALDYYDLETKSGEGPEVNLLQFDVSLTF